MGKINEEIKRLEEENFNLMVKCIRANAVIEFAERVKEASSSIVDIDLAVINYVDVADIDNLVKEMVGNNDESTI